MKSVMIRVIRKINSPLCSLANSESQRTVCTEYHEASKGVIDESFFCIDTKHAILK